MNNREAVEIIKTMTGLAHHTQAATRNSRINGEKYMRSIAASLAFAQGQKELAQMIRDLPTSVEEKK